jgi:hypothetical protein
MKILKFKSLFVLIVSLVLFAGCGDDEEVKVSPFIGNFSISRAVLAEKLSIPTNGMGTIDVQIGMDITQAIQNSLLSQVNCSSAGKSWVELREDKSMYMSCEGANALNAGTWEEISASELKLNMNSSAIPSSPTGFSLNVTNITQSATGMTGKTSVPLPKAMVAGMVAPLTLASNAPEIFIVTFSLDFVKK